MTACWIDVVAERPRDAWAAAPVAAADGLPIGWIVVWRADEDPPDDAAASGPPTPDALRADPRAFDPSGPAAWLSFVRPPARAVLFDDLAVQRARQRVMEGPVPLAVTTFACDPSHFAGSLTAWPDAAAAARDPFARVWPARLLRAGPGLVAGVPVALGPVLERYAGTPWPMDRFVTPA
jgi:hypothetical protein